ncbi:MAG TPA: class I SAM-dependent methyltransferase [Gemmatimonas sp.]|uniref:class I SAM-dependent methyltransferase n=1 Tax=Gemmatimonas sp. TaxID=1962908 RepID=UPI002ED832BC
MPDTPFRLQWFSTLIAPRTTGRILEVGCGNGQLLELLAARCPRAELIGIDRSATQVHRAMQRLVSCSPTPQVEHISGEAAGARWANQPFNLIVAMNVNFAWTDPEAAGLALRQLLAPRGRVLLGFEPPSTNGLAAFRRKLTNAAALAGFAVHAEHEPEESVTRVFAMEWRPVPRRAR